MSEEPGVSTEVMLRLVMAYQLQEEGKPESRLREDLKEMWGVGGVLRKIALVGSRPTEAGGGGVEVCGGRIEVWEVQGGMDEAGAGGQNDRVLLDSLSVPGQIGDGSLVLKTSLLHGGSLWLLSKVLKWGAGLPVEGTSSTCPNVAATAPPSTTICPSQCHRSIC
ncbi:hypothetical protein AAFF_G00390010 [Aldrovandia affinis]|uniref:Uncharacterized protein n=1 Tax=Aldrovandia affinis TaxID=143900 RepID=A0AAD7SEI6_9TELE|nr:hypothetical protein AAFF_G00390010 [Aldrovandia affinis]